MEADFPIILQTSHAVSHIENDLYLPGNLLFADGGALKTSLYGETWTVAGFFAHDGYVEGVWQAARFSWITGFIQLSASKVLVVDKWNHCLRVVNRITNSTSNFAGGCPSSGYIDGCSALFSFPVSVIHNQKNSGQFLVTDSANFAVRTLNVTTAEVGTLFTHNPHMYAGICQDSTTGNIFLTTFDGLAKYDYKTTKVTTILSSAETTIMNGLRLSNPGELLFVCNESLLIADTDNERLFAINLYNRIFMEITANCESSADEIGFADSLTYPSALAMFGDTVLVGDHHYIKKSQYVKGQLLLCSSHYQFSSQQLSI